MFNLQHFPRPAPTKNLATTENGLSPTEMDPFLGPQIQWTDIPAGAAGTRATLQVMARLAVESAAYGPFRRFAAQFQSLAELDRWTREHFTYRDEQEEIVRSPIVMIGDMGRFEKDRLVGLEGDCDDIATFLAAATKSLKYPTRLVAIRYTGINDFEHVVTQAFADGQWKTLDPTVPAHTVIRSIESMIEVV